MRNIKTFSMPHTPDYEVRWQNFKGFVDTGWIKIKPITILIGPNNAGKTSFIDPFLLMNQTITSDIGDVVFAKVTYNSDGKVLISHDFTHFPPNSRAILLEQIGIEIITAADYGN
jgi:predicted ATP-dependent endonuclease of OLD family